eukprot:SAG31_NODE_18316_length_640_cov_1.772643_1_plen_160_part_10
MLARAARAATALALVLFCGVATAGAASNASMQIERRRVQADTPQCDPVFLGNDIGFANVFEYHDSDGTCTLSIDELSDVCAEHFDECMSFLASSVPAAPQCDPVFLGPDIGFADVFDYHDSDGTCTLSINELSAVCSQHFDECMAFLESSEPSEPPQCDP